ncbi:MAG: N-acetylmuramoyl-L-alanine amidase, partial [Ginsengibacter sp.]
MSKLPILFRTIAIICVCAFNSLAFAQQPKKIKTIIIDAGHGGSDAGAHGEYEGSLRSQEKDITLAIALKLVDELKK